MLLDHFKDMLHEGQSLGATWIMHSDGLTIETTCEDGPASKGIVFDVTAANPGATATIVIGKPLGSIQRFHMVGSRCREPLPADWAGVTQVSLVNSAPMGCMVDDADRNVLSFAYSFAQDEITMRYGVDEEHVLFVVMLQIQRVPGHSRLLLMDDGLPLDETMRLLVEWVADGSAPLPMADKALEPVFSTWYAYLQNVDAETLGRELDGMSRLGCGSIFIDDGWQQYGSGRGYSGCGDWVPDPVKFPDMRATVRRFQDAGVGVVLWIAPLLLGEKAHVFKTLERYAPIHDDGLGRQFHVLDPRRKAVRDYIGGVCARMAKDYGIAGLKIDFLEQAGAYQGQPLENPEPGDVTDVGEAMRLMLERIETMLIENCGQVPVVEFRQPYSSPVIAPYSNIVRASDCPADALTNRIRTIDERLAAGNRVVHGDMLLWDVNAGAETCAAQILASFFAVPQISVPPSAMSNGQYESCRFLLSLWRKHRNVLLNGRLQPVSSILGYPLVHAFDGNGTQVSGVYAPDMIIDVDADTRTLIILNASTENNVTIRLRGDGGTVKLTGHAYDCTGAITMQFEEDTDTFRENGDATITTIPVPTYGILELALER